MNDYTYLDNQKRMAVTAMVFGIIALFFSYNLFFLSIPAACFAALFAFLSRGYQKTLHPKARIGLITGAAGVLISILIIGTTLHSLKTDPEYRENIAKYADMLYGDTMEEETGESYSDLINEWFGEGSN